MLRDQVKEYISRLSDQDLTDYIRTGTEAFDPEAVDFARQELERRNLDPAQRADLEEEAAIRGAERHIEIARQIAEPLPLRGRIFAFMAGMLFGFHVLLEYFVDHGDGPYRRSQDRRKFMLLGLMTTILLLVIYAMECSFTPKH
jgi:hypothetical protein